MEQQLILDRYRPLEELGRGGYATVTLAWDTRMHRRVAIKRLKLPLDRKTGAVMRNPPGLAEARTAAMLNHPAIVTVYDFETDSDEAFLITEYADGANLGELLDDVGGPLTLDETATVLKAVSDALTFAHENGVLHLDIKPANVLVMRDGRIKVADFGMAELSTATGHDTSFGGTVGYMPLEQLEGMRVSEASDEWALAVLSYECLTGANPFDAKDFPSAITLLETTDLPPASAIEEELPREIDDILFAATGLRPQDRYRTVHAFAKALTPHLGDPRAGQDSLAELVEAYADDETIPEEPSLLHVGLWDRLQTPYGMAALRAVAAAESTWLTWAGLAPTHLQPLPLFGAVALAALVGAIAPALGTALGLIAFSAGLFAERLWVLASLFSIAAALWWWFVARRRPGAAVLPLSAPVLALVRIPFVTPLLAGFSLPVLPAAAAGLTGGLLALLASSASDQTAPYTTVVLPILTDPARGALVADNVRAAFLNPASWVALLGWPVAAAFMSLFARRATRFSALVGAALGGSALLGANMLARIVAETISPASAADAWTGTAFAISLIGSLILVVFVAALGAPARPEEEQSIRIVYKSE